MLVSPLSLSLSLIHPAMSEDTPAAVWRPPYEEELSVSTTREKLRPSNNSHVSALSWTHVLHSVKLSDDAALTGTLTTTL